MIRHLQFPDDKRGLSQCVVTPPEASKSAFAGFHFPSNYGAGALVPAL